MQTSISEIRQSLIYRVSQVGVEEKIHVLSSTHHFVRGQWSSQDSVDTQLCALRARFEHFLG